MPRFAFLSLICSISCHLACAACTTGNATSAVVRGLWHENDYNGEFHRGVDEFNLNGQPTFWQNVGSPERTCGHILDKFVGKLEPGECTANSWISLPTGHESPEECLKVCESHHVNGCCRWGPASPSSGGVRGCSMGHGRTSYRDGAEFATRVGGNTSSITRCAGRAFIFYCPAVKEWNMAPPSAWDVIDHGGCYDAATRAYYHSVVLGSQDLADGFRKEWGWKNTYGHYVEVKSPVELKCEKKSPPSSHSKKEEQVALRAEGVSLAVSIASSCEGAVAFVPLMISSLFLFFSS